VVGPRLEKVTTNSIVGTTGSTPSPLLSVRDTVSTWDLVGMLSSTFTASKSALATRMREVTS